MIRRASPETLFWIDETYVDYVDKSESIERFASESENVVVCKSMSKVYALSGLRVGYLCGPSSMIGTAEALQSAVVGEPARPARRLSLRCKTRTTTPGATWRLTPYERAWPTI